jgi:very-short-patch-repair endonuclease
MFAVRMPTGAFFSHVTAATLQSIPVPFTLERRPLLDIGVPAPARAPHASGIRGHSLTLSEWQTVTTDGLAHTSVERTWCDLASVLSIADLVAAGDFLIHWREPLTTTLALYETVIEFPGKRGVKKMFAALPCLSDRSESPPESRLRFHIFRAGLPGPQVNHVIVMTDNGPGVRTDLAFVKYRVILEYQGDYHRGKEQWRKDMTRRSRLEAQGWYVMEINADDLRDPVELMARIRSVLVSHGWRP